MTRRTRTFAFIIGFVFLSVFAVGQGVLRMQAAAQEEAISGAPREKADLVVVTFSSQWCAPCKILKPRLADVKPDFKNKNVRFVELDFTFGEMDDFATMAMDEGFLDIYNQYKGATGFSVLVDKQTGKSVDVLTVEYSNSAMRAAISRGVALAQTASSKAIAS